MNTIYTGKCEPTENVQKALAEVIFTAINGALPLYEERVRKLAIDVNNGLSDDEFEKRYESIFKMHTQEIIEIAKYRLRENNYFLSRIDAIIQDPSALLFGDFSFDEPCHAGFIYSAFWYAITDVPHSDPALCVQINRAHNEMMEKTLEKANKTVIGNKYGSPKNNASCLSSSWPYLLGVLIFGFIIGVIISLS